MLNDQLIARFEHAPAACPSTRSDDTGRRARRLVACVGEAFTNLSPAKTRPAASKSKGRVNTLLWRARRRDPQTSANHFRPKSNLQASRRKCCKFENGDGRSERNRAAKRQTAKIEQMINELILMANSTAADPACLPLADQRIASYPSIVRRVARKSRKLCSAVTRIGSR